MQNDKTSGPTASGLLKKISHYEFLGTLYLLRNILPSLAELSKTFQTGSLNFSKKYLKVFENWKSTVENCEEETSCLKFVLPDFFQASFMISNFIEKEFSEEVDNVSDVEVF